MILYVHTARTWVGHRGIILIGGHRLLNRIIILILFA